MSDKTGIEWTDATWNPLRGCSRVSEGCRNCYAETVAKRFSGEGQPYAGLIARGGQWNGQIRLAPEGLTQPLRWRRPRRIFVNSMSDLFHENVPTDFIDRVFAVMASAEQHTFQVLTKRPERMRDYMLDLRTRLQDIGQAILHRGDGRYYTDPDSVHDHAVDRAAQGFPNVWLGVSVENQAAADARIPVLLETPAAVRWVSVEPLLERITFEGIFANPRDPRDGTNALEALDWVVVGGESGVDARPMHPDWVRLLRDQCAVAETPFLFKQWGEWLPFNSLEETANTGRKVWGKDASLCVMWRNGIMGRAVLCSAEEAWLDGCRGFQKVGKKAAGRLLDGQLHDAYPEVQP